MKKMILATLTVLALLASCANPLASPADALASESAARDLSGNVALVKAKSMTSGHYGITTVQRSFTIKVKNLSSTKTVAVHHSKLDGTWVDVAATYKGAAEAGYEFWTAEIYYNQMYDTSYTWGDKFVVTMSANGASYWDNNNGADYSLTAHGGVLLGNGINVAQESSWANQYTSMSKNSFYISASVRNLAPSKIVKIVYTFDGWKTNQTMNLNYNASTQQSYSSPIPSPNAYGVENWSVSFDTSMDKMNLEYAIAYTVNGVTYWDNNGGNNYKLVPTVY